MKIRAVAVPFLEAMISKSHEMCLIPKLGTAHPHDINGQFPYV
jgi:hypothetical protein